MDKFIMLLAAFLRPFSHAGENQLSGIFLPEDFPFSVLFGANSNNKTGSSTKLVKVATKRVADVSQPKAMVPPKLLAQNMMNPAINTRAVYTILSPVFFMVARTVASTLLL